MGSWNTIAMRAPQYRRISFGPSVPISSPSNLIDPYGRRRASGAAP